MANQSLISCSVRNGNDVTVEHISSVSTVSILASRFKFRWSGLPTTAS